MGLLKSFKKVLKSPIGKAAMLAGLGYFGPKMFGADAGFGQWGNAYSKFDAWPMWKKAATVGGITMGAGAIENEIEEKTESVVDTSGHEGYLNSRKMFVDEWTQWLMDSDEDLSYEEARTQAERALFNKAQGGLIGLAQGGRIGLQKGSNRQPGMNVHSTAQKNQITRDIRNLQSQMEGSGASAQDYVNVYADPSTHPGTTEGKPPREGIKTWVNNRVDQLNTWNKNKYNQHAKNTWLTSVLKDHGLTIADIPEEEEKANEFFQNLAIKGADLTGKQKEQFQKTGYYPEPKDWWGTSFDVPISKQATTSKLDLAIGNKYTGATPNLSFYKPGVEEWSPSYMENEDVIKTTKNDPNWLKKMAVYEPNRYAQYKGDVTWNPVQGKFEPKEGQGIGPIYYPGYVPGGSPVSGGGGSGGTGSTEGDYYGFKEWEDWTGAPTTPLFGDATTYQGLLSKGGRIGLYGGGMGAMNNSMNPMMNKGLGAMGSPGMNPYNQQNLMQQAQMRGQPQGRPPMPGGPNMAQGPGITGTQAAAQVAEKEQDTELLQLIRMLASLGIPMEQLRGRTKEELVEMVISVKSRTQPEGRGEVVEEEQEEIMTAAHGGRVRAAGGLGEYPPQGSYPNSDLEFQTEAEASMGNPGNAEMYIEEDEEEQIYVPRAGGGLMRTRYAMGSEQPIIPSKDGPQIDYRGIGGYQPHGAKEKKDDVRALLAQGEFVVTSDAVKGIGGGDRDVGAKRMYDLMHKYEPVGRALS